ncbi:bacillithiol biosynthesis deacetylase BshB1 [Dethiobacter alkaliphilus]|uniref:bacillithiol biosynthesis deacetylase BshB1 n=1 Tax=Dethiobacter alkaliphilus TaxID=427926 RepID=UPI002225BD55|nr:bacillithiol biosynthesis deacetylase BshB1 [Dethiobacter alkaliphilus]MCW3491295.1 bacillithiol biosynthesis deacetylase BshB1 [Dethiobacter alkaliphilus]
MQLDILAFGAHPDDVEIGIGGTLIKHAAMGYKCGIVDLTAGEMGSNGTPEIRRKEALKAAEIMGMEVRDCLGLPDARLKVDEDSLRVVIEVIRRYQPKVVIGPYFKDRHPDHLRASQLVQEAAHLAGLWRYPADGEPHRPPVMAQFFLALDDEPTVIVDISDHYEKKMGALCAHESQFGMSEDTDWKTLVNDPAFMRMIQSRDQYVGAKIQVMYGEGIYLSEPMEQEDLMSLRGRLPKLVMERVKKDVK